MTPAQAADPYDARRALRATGRLADFDRAGVLTAADVHVATTLGRLGGEGDERVLLAVALAVRGVRLGSVCVDLGQQRATVTADTEEAVDLSALPWPDAEEWYAACAASPIVARGPEGPPQRPVRLVEPLLYLDRYWRQEQHVRADLAARAARPLPEPDAGRLAEAVAALFPGPAPDHQRLAAVACVNGWVTVVAGGPGTGKTTTVARLLALLQQTLDRPVHAALAAPTAKAAARLQEAVAVEAQELAARGLPTPGALGAATLHRLLGWRPGSHTRFRHHRDNRLPYDVVVVDETSMVSLTMMSRLLEAVRPDARLVLVGDPDQLASVEAGAVLGDLVGRPPRPGPDARAVRLGALVPADLHPRAEVAAELGADVVRLRRRYRYGGSIAVLAEGIRTGRPEDVLAVLRSGAPDVDFVETDTAGTRAPAGLDELRADVRAAGRALTDAARAGDVAAALAALDRHRLLCAHRRGPYGIRRWSAEVARWVAEAVGDDGAAGAWYAGRPLVVTANDYEVGLYNGDTGVVVEAGPTAAAAGRGRDTAEGARVAAFARGATAVLVPPSRLSAVETMHAMTVHRSQGSQFDRVSVLLPPPDSPLLTRELLYTAVTRGRRAVRVVGSAEAVRLAVRRPVVRASGLRRPTPPPSPCTDHAVLSQSCSCRRV